MNTMINILDKMEKHSPGSIARLKYEDSDVARQRRKLQTFVCVARGRHRQRMQKGFDVKLLSLIRDSYWKALEIPKLSQRTPNHHPRHGADGLVMV